jgi:ElaB/YqjD/DUF883 family membrane-anchored ribosome-binding protein
MTDYRNDDDRTLPTGMGGMNLTPEKDPEHLIPEHTHAAAPGTIGAVASSDPDAVRDEIERTRQRMSQTIDQLEGALSRKKSEIQGRLDFVAPVRENPWIFAAGVFGTGLVLGLLTGGGDDDRDHVKVPRALLAGMDLEENGGASGATRTGDLLQVIARQEEEIRDLRAALYDDDVSVETYEEVPDESLLAAGALGDVNGEDEWDEDWNFDDRDDALNDFGAFGVEGERGGFLRKAVTAAVAAGLSGAIGGVGKKLAARRGRARGMDVEVELEEPRTTAASELDVEVELERESHGRRLPVSPLAGAVAAGAAALVGGLVAKLVHDRRGSSDLDVEVELERQPSFRPTAPAQPVATQTAPVRTAASADGELEVEVDLEQRGHLSSPQPVSAERQYEVELERPDSDVPLM